MPGCLGQSRAWDLVAEATSRSHPPHKLPRPVLALPTSPPAPCPYWLRALLECHQPFLLVPRPGANKHQPNVGLLQDCALGA